MHGIHVVQISKSPGRSRRMPEGSDRAAPRRMMAEQTIDPKVTALQACGSTRNYSRPPVKTGSGFFVSHLTSYVFCIERSSAIRSKFWYEPVVGSALYPLMEHHQNLNPIVKWRITCRYTVPFNRILWN